MKAGSHFCRKGEQLRGLVQGSKIPLWRAGRVIEEDGSPSRGLDSHAEGAVGVQGSEMKGGILSKAV